MRSARLTIVLTALAICLFFTNPEALLAQSQGDASGEKGARASVLRKDEAVAQLQSSKAERASIEVSFEGGVEAAELRKTVSPTEATVKSLLYKWGEHRAGYNVDEGQTLDEALDDFGERHAQFLLRQIANLSAPSGQPALATGSTDQVDTERARQELLNEFSAQLALLQEKGLVISGFVAEDAPAGLSRLLKSLRANNASFQINTVVEDDLDPNSKSPNPEENSGSEGYAADAPVTATGVPYPNEGGQWKFSPSRGRIIYDSKSRSFTSYFSWEDKSGFDSTHIAYEHDITIFKNKDTYVKPDEGKLWFSNLPSDADKHSNDDRVYKENRFMDTYTVFSMGTAAATAIKPGALYYTEIPVAVVNENAGPAYGAIQPQLGSWAGEYDDGDSTSEFDERWKFCEPALKIPGANDYANCIFNDQTYTIVNYANDSGVFRNFPFDHRVSATYYWDKAYNPNPPQISCPQGKFKAEYRNVKEKDGATTKNLIIGRCESFPINYNWGNSSPGIGVEDDNFEVEWNGQFTFPQGTYRFIASSDDSMRVYIDGTLIIDSWTPHAEREDRIDRFMSGGLHNVRVIYKEIGGQAVAKFRGELLTGTGCTATVAPGQWKGEYFNNLTLSGTPVMVRDDSDTNGSTFFAHVWGTGSPSSGCRVNSDNFSARWTRRQHFDAGRYRFTLRADDGVRLYVDNVLRLDRWVDQAPESRSVEVDLATGQHDLRVEYYERSGGAVAQIYWERNGGTVQPTISKYTWDTPPRANQPFSGGVIGTGLVVSGTQVWFCLAGTNNCYQHPSAGVTVSNSTNLRITNANLSGGSWQMYVQTSAGQSPRSAEFTVQAAPANCIATVASGRWKGEYFNNRDLSGSPVMVRDDSSSSTPFFAHDWNTGSPNSNCGVNSDNFSARWTRRQHFDAGRYRFTLRADDGVRLYVDNVLRLNRWFDQASANQSFDLDIPAGQHDLRVEYYEHGGSAVAQIYWERIGGNSPPTISGYALNSPRPNQSFSGTVTGTGFAPGATQLFFCVSGGTTCYQHPAAGVSVNSATNLSITNANLGAGSWQLYVKTPAGQSARSNAFTVQSPPVRPTISGYSWNPTPKAGQSFGGTINGSGFVSGGTQVFFCLSGTNTCYQQPSAGVSVNSSTRLSVTNANVGYGLWQVYVKTSAGQSERSSSFTVHPAAPTVTRYSWSTTPRAGQSFAGNISGSGFIAGGTQVWFCLSGSNTCYQHPSSGVRVNSLTGLDISNVRLGAASWQVYVQTYAGTSSRSSTFTVR